MRWKLLRRRLSVSAPRMIVRSHLPWPLRWAVVAVVLGFSAALALWAFEFGKDIAGLDRDAKEELAQLRSEVSKLRADSAQAQLIANTADSLLKAERTTQERLAQQVRQLESERQALRADLGFFENLMPVAGDALQVRGLQAKAQAPGQLRYQLLVMLASKDVPDFDGRYDVVLAGTRDGRPWSQAMSGGPQPLQFKQYRRVEGVIEHPAEAVIKTVQAKVVDHKGAVRATQLLKL
jgi:hypothetical protein